MNKLFLIIVGIIIVISIIVTIIFICMKKLDEAAQKSYRSGNDLDKIVATVKKSAKEFAININPEYKTLKCPSCGAPLPDNIKICTYCKAPLTKVLKNRK